MRIGTAGRICCGTAGALILLAACSSSGGTSSTTAKGGSGSSSATASTQAAQAVLSQYSSAPTAIPVTTPLATKPAKGKLIFLTQGAVPGVVKLGDGEQAAAAAAGWSFSTINYDQANPASLNSALQTALAEHPTAVSETGALPSEVSTSVLAAYRAAKIPIIVSTVASTATNDPYVLGNAGGPASYAAAAKAVAAWFVADSEGTGRAVVADVPALTVLADWTASFKSEVATLCSACSVQVLTVSLSSAEDGQEASEAVSTLRRNPSYKYLFFDDGDFGIGINAALSSAGLSDIKIGGSDFQPQEATALRAGEQSAWTGENLLDIGYTNVDIALRSAEHMSVAADSNPQPTELFTKANIGNLNGFAQPANALQSWEALWKVSAAS